MAKARTRRQNKTIILDEPKPVNKPLWLTTDYTARLRAIGDILNEVIMVNLKRNNDLSFGGFIDEEQIKQIHLLTRVRRVNGRRQPGHIQG